MKNSDGMAEKSLNEMVRKHREKIKVRVYFLPSKGRGVKFYAPTTDELGFLPLDLEGAKFLFELISNRFEKGAIILTSNRPFT